MTIPESFAIALQHHQAGRLREAEGLYREILAAEPNHADALHLLGVIAHQSGRHDLAVDWIGRSLALFPKNAGAWSNLGEVYRALGRGGEAVAAYRRALQLQPASAKIYQNLGMALSDCGQTDEAIAAYRRAVQIEPDHVDAWSNLGIALAMCDRLDEAVAAFRQVLALRLDFAEGHNNLANTLGKRGQYAEAIAAYRRALELDPGYAVAHNNLGIALSNHDRTAEAVVAFRAALQLAPQFAEAYSNLGNALREQGELDEAAAACRRALELKPDYAEAWNNLGIVYAEQGRLDEGIAACRRAAEISPTDAKAWNNLGIALVKRGRYGEGEAAYRRAVQIRPAYAIAHNNLGNALREQARFEESIAACRRALELRPNYGEAHNNLGLALAECGRLDEATVAFHRALELKPDDVMVYNNQGIALKDGGRIEEAVVSLRRAHELDSSRPWIHSNFIYALHFLPNQDAREIAAEQRRWNERFAAPLRVSRQPRGNDRDPGRALRVGYVSPDFRDHVVGRNLLPLFEHHDRRQFEIFHYSEVTQPDRLTAKMRERPARWREILGIGDEAVAEMIRQDGVDILVDLSQHMARNRLPVFARQPAPVQVSFAGYPEGTGVEAIRYRITDRYLEGNNGMDVKNGKDEQLCFVDSFWCYDPCGVEVEVNALPAEANGVITFGCLNNYGKTNEQVLRLWARVLVAVKDSRLIMLSPEGGHRERCLKTLREGGVEAGRVEFVARLARRPYLELHRRLDIVLDPFPYNGHTTSLDALSMGVPVVTLAGQPAVSRAGYSQLLNLGLPELAAFSEDEYVTIAAHLGGDLPRLAELRRTLRPRMLASALMDGARFARGIETVYRTIWRHWCAENQS